MSLRLPPSLLLSLLVIGIFGQQAGADFSGNWTLNLEKSHRGRNSPLLFYKRFHLAIQQSGSEIRIREDVVRTHNMKDTQVLVFRTDGRDYPVQKASTTTMVSGKWEGDQLVEHIRWGAGEVTRKMTLSPDGKTITADWQFLPLSGMPVIATEVWQKQ